MAIHPSDRLASNPRLQCSCCGKWKRLMGTKIENGHCVQFYRFFGGCGYTNGDHLAAKRGNTNDVCDDCCQRECKRLSEAKACQKRIGDDGYSICDYCGSMWSPLLCGLGWLPLSCPDRIKEK